MRSPGTRRFALVAGVATTVAVALAGCSAGQVAETAKKNPSVYGVSLQNSDNSVLIRGLAVTYNGSEGYAQGESAPLELNLFNTTRETITVLVRSAPAGDAITAKSVELVGGSGASSSPSAAPEPTGSRPVASPQPSSGESEPVEQPSADPSLAPTPAASGVPDAGGQPARIEIGPENTVSFRPGDSEQLVASGLSGKLIPGSALNLAFEFSNGAEPLVAAAPVSIPFSPASREPGVEEPAHSE